MQESRLIHSRHKPNHLPFKSQSLIFLGEVDLFKDLFLESSRTDIDIKEVLVELKSTVKEANDACLWLKAAGFPQYVQMFADRLFPINLSKFQVEKDHKFLDQADLDSLLRRLNTLNRCADVMDSIRNKGTDSDEEVESRALSDKWQFRRKQKKWSRRRDSKVSSPKEAVFSSTEDLLDDDIPKDHTPTNQSSLMMVSELRKSLTGLDRAVKTYSFMMTDDHVPVIQVERASIDTTQRSLLQMSSACSSFESDEDFDDIPCPNGGMDNFATGIMDTFESNLLKLKGFQTQSLPDVFEATKHFADDASSDASALSSTNTSVASILDATDVLDPVRSSPNEGSRAVYPTTSPLTLTHNGTISPKIGKEFEEDDNCYLEKRNRDDDDDMRKRRPNRVSSAGSCRTWGSNSPMGSESSERGAPSPQPLALERLKFHSGSSSGSIMVNGVDSPAHQRESSFDEVSSKRISKISVTSLKFEDPARRFEPKWHSYQQPHDFRTAFRPVRSLLPIEELSVGHISVLRKLSLVKLTAQIELYSYKSKTSISRMLKGKKHKLGDIKYKRVFGVPLFVNVRNTGQALPPVISHAMDYLRADNRMELLGLFRRAASKARVDLLKEVAESDPEFSNFEEFTAYEVADMIKLYCRELPEPLLTNKLSEILVLIQENVPSQVRLPALQAIMLLMPDEHREALQVLLLFLREVASYSETNQMTAQNLAVCFAPNLFSLSSAPLYKVSSGMVRKGSFKRNTLTPGLSPTQLASNKEVTDSVVSSHCLSQMICQVDKLFKVATDMLQVCRFTHLETGDPVPYYELGLDRLGNGNLHYYLDTCVHTVLREVRKKFKAWSHYDCMDGVEVSYLKPRDGVPLWVWRGACEVNIGSSLLQRRLWMDRYVWNRTMTAPKLVAKIDDQTEVFQYVTSSSPPFTERDHCLLRSWQYDVTSQCYVLVATSVSHPSANLQGGIRAMQLATYYLVEPLDGDRARLSYICRADMRGRSADYYNKGYGAYLATTVSRVRDACEDHNVLETSV